MIIEILLSICIVGWLAKIAYDFKNQQISSETFLPAAAIIAIASGAYIYQHATGVNKTIRTTVESTVLRSNDNGYRYLSVTLKSQDTSIVVPVVKEMGNVYKPNRLVEIAVLVNPNNGKIIEWYPDKINGYDAAYDKSNDSLWIISFLAIILIVVSISGSSSIRRSSN